MQRLKIRPFLLFVGAQVVSSMSLAEVTEGLSLHVVSPAPAARVELGAVSLGLGLPPELSAEPEAHIPFDPRDGDFVLELRAASTVAAASLPLELGVVSLDRRGQLLDANGPFALEEIACPPTRAATDTCLATRPLRVVGTLLDRHHPRLRGHSLLGVPGGRLVIEARGLREEVSIGGPPWGEAGEALEVLSPKLRVRLVRATVGGQDAFGGGEQLTLEVMGSALTEAMGVLGQCGLTLSEPLADTVSFLEPPGTNLLTIGCDGGLPAAGGTIRFVTRLGPVEVRTQVGQSALAVALDVELALAQKGYSAVLYRNARQESSARPSFDLKVLDRSGRAVSLNPPAGAEVSSDPTLRVCLTPFDLGDGVSHFDDLNAAAGTAEERLLIRALADDDPSTIDLLVIPEFAGQGRIGESFIYSGGGSIQNVLILDRSGIRALPRSMTLAHEMGHVLLNLPGHPDDFGQDQSSHLMDADASDPSVFGPRRLLPDDCLRLLKESGPDAVVPLVLPLGSH